MAIVPFWAILALFTLVIAWILVGKGEEKIADIVKYLLADPEALKTLIHTVLSVTLATHVAMLERVGHWKWAMHHTKSFVPCGFTCISCNKTASHALSIACCVYHWLLAFSGWALFVVSILTGTSSESRTYHHLVRLLIRRL